ncbi:MAG: T9SS type A sorting domain-containing protein [Ignavibacteriae bacterium]|nr:T9SS type A sorting domain-containing protein [Ignavibacteriota bacterium]
MGLSGNVRLELYDYKGTLREVLADGYFESGEYSLDFDLPAGLYFCRINAGMYNDVQKFGITY